MTTSADELPQDVTKLCGEVQYEETSEIPVEHGYIWTSCASVENENPIFWDEGAAEVIAGGPIAPPSMVSVWFRPHHWAPGRTHELLPLQVHFDLKERLGLPEAVMTDDTIVFHEPVRVGDLLRTHQVLRSVSGPKTTKLGEGRFWVIDVVYTNQRDELVAVETYTGFGYRRAAAGTTASAPTSPAASTSATTASGSPADQSADESADDAAEDVSRTTGVKGAADDHSPRLMLSEVTAGQQLPELRYKVTATTVVLGALATRDWRPMHHDKDFAIERNGTRDIFLNTPNQAAWFERYLTDWTGPHGRLARIGFRMKGSVFPGDTMVMRGEVVGVSVGDDGCGWADLSLELAVGDTVATTATARVALPLDPNDNPWSRRSERWNP